jgi:hypothetical protein
MSGGPAVSDWDRIVHKNVRAKYTEPIENVAAVGDDHRIVIPQGLQAEHSIPNLACKDMMELKYS